MMINQVTPFLGETILSSQISADQYHHWRSRGEFFTEIEKPFISKILKSLPVPSRRILDVAAGTGLWTSLCSEIFPEAELIGLDIDDSYISYARQYNGNHAHFLRADVRQDHTTGKFDLAIVAMAVDYIGIAATCSYIRRVLIPGGYGVLWYLEQKRYQTYLGGRVKRWDIGGRRALIFVNEITKTQLLHTFWGLGMATIQKEVAFKMADGIPRIFQVIIVQKQYYPHPTFQDRKSLGI